MHAACAARESVCASTPQIYLYFCIMSGCVTLLCSNCQNITLPPARVPVNYNTRAKSAACAASTLSWPPKACTPASQQGKASYSCLDTPTEEGIDMMELGHGERQQQVSLPLLLLLNSAETSNSTCPLQHIKQDSWHKGQLADTTNPSRQRLQSQRRCQQDLFIIVRL